MKRILLIIVLSFITLNSCEKYIDKDLLGSYHLEGVKINCSYYECDSVKVVWTVKIEDNHNPKNKADVAIFYFDEDNIIHGLGFDNDNYKTEDDVTTFKGNNYEQLTINHITKKMVYEKYLTSTAYNITSEFLRKDTLSSYIILEGYKD